MITAKMLKNAKNKKGFALATTVIILFVLLLFTFTLYALLLPSMEVGFNFFDSVQARYQATAGVSRLISTIRNESPTLPSTLGDSITLPLVVDAGFSYNGTVVVKNTGSRRYTADVFGYGGVGAARMFTVVFSSLNTPNATDGAACAYAISPPAIIVGSSFINGSDYKLPTTFACKDIGCAPTELETLNSVASTYNSTSGGINSQASLLELANYITSNNIKSSAQNVGSREAPLITVIPAGQNLLLNADGAGLLIVSDTSTLLFATGAHYEGFVVIIGSGSIVGDATNYIYGALLFVSPPAENITFNGTKPNVVYSASAISNLKKLNVYLTRIISHLMFTF